ncbi:cft-1 [Sodiomyces alkalinus F11]|uniref:Cft-1 n=1 Tax=Sodiomyces alkalinus (strain CBS 110278 / VKM F-3762 / F11) TaxID=1314773 RepID=A0A3N2PZN1_SODAK|nr:cft-1 [Sodiomyces alkalinus F11]ROT39981.1 cft-1 [Sodiomyces alkalinus F11]
MQCYTELVPPTVVSCAVSLPFTSAHSENLVVAKGSLLQVFATKTVSTEIDNSQASATPSVKPVETYDRRLNDGDGLDSSFLGGDAMLLRADRTTSTKLVLIAEYPLHGIIRGLARIKIQHSRSGGEALLVHTRVARLSLVQWDPERNGIEDISIHYYEKDEWQGAPTDGPLRFHGSQLQTDPQSRCAALKFGLRKIAFLPFRQTDEDIDMGDWDEDVDGPRPEKESSASVGANGSGNNANNSNNNNNNNSSSSSSSNAVPPVPYTSSFVLSLPRLDPDLLHPVHFSFLHEYREPTFGIISSTSRRSNVRRLGDHFSYKVFTIDLHQKASTAILSVNNLPQTLFQIIPLPHPIGGALLVGSNELIHIDQSGKANGVAVNPFAKEMTQFPLADQADLQLRLEHCSVELMSAETGEMLMVLSDGRMAIVSFKMDGRTVAGVAVKLVPAENGGNLLPYQAACMARLGKNSLFVGSIGSDSVVLGWTRRQLQAARKKARLLDDALDYDLADGDLDDEDEDDLYGEGPTITQSAAAGIDASRGGDLDFRIHDSLVSMCPLMDLTPGKPSYLPGSEEAKNSGGVRADLQLACAVGRHKAGSLALLNRNIQPKVIGRFDFPEARGFWTMRVQKPIPKSLQGDKGANLAVGDNYDSGTQYDKFMIVSKVDLDGYETSDVYALTGAGFEALSGTEFDPAAGFTVEAGTMGNDMRIIQVLRSEVRSYDGDLGLSQILPMLDEETGAEPRVVKASILDPYLLLVREDSSVLIAQINTHSELEEIDKGDSTFTSTKWLTGCLYKDNRGLFAPLRTDKGSSDGESPFMFLLSTTGALYIYGLPDLTNPVYVASGLSYIPPMLSAEYSVRRGTSQEAISELLVADLGDQIASSPYLILRHPNDDITIYEPFRLPSTESSSDLARTLYFHKVSNPHIAKGPETPEETTDDESVEPARPVPLRSCANIGGYSAVFLSGPSPSFIIKSSKSVPRVMGLQGLGVRGMSPFHTEGCERGFIYADSKGCARVTQLPTDTSLAELGVSVRKIPLGDAVSHVAYHPTMECYAAACSVTEPFELPKDDDYHKEWAKENCPMLPTMERGLVKLISPATWTVIDTFELDQHEVAMCMETLHLEISEETKERRMLITVGTAVNKGEDLPIRGRILVLDVVSVIPEPDRPETDRKLKLIAKEEIPRGAVTALSEVGSQGLMLVAQGQKCMVRGLKEDGSLLPVAFLDMNCYVTAVRELRGTGYCLMADAFKGVWFVGYSEEPYRMTLFGKSSTTLRCLTADFLASGNELSIVVCDEDGVLHILQFDPEHPRSLQGHLLLNRASFSADPNHVWATLNLPRANSPSSPTTPSASDPATSSQVLLLASPSGALHALHPISEPAYRRLTSLASSLTNALPHAAGMNPKGHRLPPQDNAARLPGVDISAGRSVVDGTLLARWTELGARQRAEAAGKGGYADPADVRAELEGLLGWAGFAYF